MGKDTFLNHREGVTSVVQGPGSERLRLCVARRGSLFCTAIYLLGGDPEPGQVSAHPEEFGAVRVGGARKKGAQTADCSAAPPKFVGASLEPVSRAPQTGWGRAGWSQSVSFSLLCIHSPV